MRAAGKGSGTSLLLVLVLLACISPAQAGLGPATVARDWCHDKTLQYLMRHGYAPYNWQATTRVEGDDYVTKGVWSVDADEIKVKCIAPKQGSKPSGKYQIEGIEVSDGRKAKPRTP